MIPFSISVAYTFTNAILALVILYKSRKSILTQFYTFCMGCLIMLGVAAYMLPGIEDRVGRLIMGRVVDFLYTMFPFFFLHFMVLFVRRYDILKSKSVIVAVYFAGLFSYTMMALGLVQSPISVAGGITTTGYVFYIIWMSIFFCIGIAMLYSLVEGFSEKGVKSNLLLAGFAILLLILPGPFTESVFFTIFRQNVVVYFFTSTIALIIVVYLVFRHKIIVNTPYDALKSVLSAINDLIIRTNEEMQITLVRGGVASNLGYEEKELVGRSVGEIIAPREYVEAYRGYARTGKMQQAFFDCEVLHRNGHRIPMNFSFTPIFANEEIAGFVGVGRNISERKRAEVLQDAVYSITKASDATVRLEELFRAVHEIIRNILPAENFCIALYEQHLNSLTYPYFVDERTPRPPDHIVAHGLPEFVLHTGKSLLCTEEHLERMRKSGEVDFEGTPARIWLGVPLMIGKKIIGIMALRHYSDPRAYGEHEQNLLEYISSQVAKAIDRRRAEERIRSQAELIDIVPNPILVCDLEGKILFWSKGAERLYGQSFAEVARQPVLNVLFEGQEDVYARAMADVKNGQRWRSEIIRTTKDGRELTLESSWLLVSDDEQEKSLLIVETDITEKKLLESQFLRAQRLESVGTLASGIAHDLNNVLAPILTVIQSLKRRYTKDNDQQLLSILESNTKRGAAIVNQVLTFARGVHGERTLLQPRHLINEMVKIAGETFPKTIRILSNLSPTLRSIIGDSTQLHQILLNLFVNARDAMPLGGTLTVNAENIDLDEEFVRLHIESQPGPYVVISVTDTGMGIPPEILDKIFEPFFTTKDQGKGTGLGLSTVNGIVKNHNGFINVYSEQGKGTTFKVYLPAAHPAETTDSGDEEHPLTRGNGELVLVVDDEDIVRDVTKRTLESYGYTVLTAINGEDALKLYGSYTREVALVISDVMMPVLDGRELIKEIRSNNGDVRIIATSGLTTEERVAELENLGVNGYLSKPYTEHKLVRLVQQLLG
jgi:two-component system, cell cycle sensor histidine kinase and response regulator CckA